MEMGPDVLPADAHLGKGGQDVEAGDVIRQRLYTPHLPPHLGP